MKKILAVMAISSLLPFAGGTQSNAAEFPNWRLSETCKPGDSSCVRFEQLARGQISGTWKTLPAEILAGCVIETKSVEKSYRLLQSCLANAMQEILKDQQRSPEGGDVVQLTPMVKTPAPPTAAPEAPAAAPEAVKPQ